VFTDKKKQASAAEKNLIIQGRLPVRTPREGADKRIKGSGRKGRSHIAPEKLLTEDLE